MVAATGDKAAIENFFWSRMVFTEGSRVRCKTKWVRVYQHAMTDVSHSLYVPCATEIHRQVSLMMAVRAVCTKILVHAADDRRMVHPEGRGPPEDHAPVSVHCT